RGEGNGEICSVWTDPLWGWGSLFYPRSSLVFTASCLSISATISSAICWVVCWLSLIVSSATLSFDFFSLFIALVRTFRSDSLALFVFCLASLTSISLYMRITYLGIGTRIIVPSTSGFRFIPLSLMALIAAAVHCKPDQKVIGIRTPLTSGKLAIFTKTKNFPSSVTPLLSKRNHSPAEVLMFRFLLKSSLRASITVCRSLFTSSRLIISSTKAALRFTLAWACPLPLARNYTFDKHEHKEGNSLSKTIFQKWQRMVLTLFF
uniref:Uncharacterized protein n=1 Tax=Ornithorhynchus anatinus TaxID=9258 RepID=A0A6I8NVT5_ORNAN